MRRFSFLAIACSLIVLTGCGGGSSGSPVPVTYVPPTSGPFVYVMDGGFNVLQILQSQNGVVAPSAAISGPNTGLQNASGIVRDASGNVYVAIYGNSFIGSEILVYPPALAGNVTPRLVIAGALTGLSGPFGLAIDGQGRLIVANTLGNSITIFAAGANGNVAPAVTIAGAATTLSSPSGIALDAAGNLYVSNQSGTITVFAAGASGNAAPLRTISGAATQLNVPLGLCFDAGGNLYVANENSNTITEYAPGATGNAAPAVTIAGSNTLLAEPQELVIGSGGLLFVTNLSVPGVPGLMTVYASGAAGNVAPVQSITRMIGPIGISL